MGRLANALWARGSNGVAKAEILPSWNGTTSQLLTVSPSVLEAFGINTSSDTVTRAEAMSIPAMRRGRQVIAGTLGAVPLTATRIYGSTLPERVTIPFLKQPHPSCTRAWQMTWTIDDLMFRSVSWWYVEEFGYDKFPAKAFRLDPGRVNVDYANQQITVDGVPIKDPRRIIRFDGPDEGILTHGARTLRTCLLLEAAVRNYARMDIPLGYFQGKDNVVLDDEITAFLDDWEKHRAARSTGFVPGDVEYKNPQFNAEQMQLAQARGYQSTEVARLLNLPASYINAPTNDPMTYNTTEANRRELVDVTYAPYIAAIEGRLSMPDITPLGTTVAFDLGKFLRGDMKTLIDTGAAAVASGLMTVDEVRTEWLNLPPLSQENTDV